MSFELYGLPIKDEEYESASFRNVNVVTYLMSFFRETTLQGVPPLVKSPGILRKALWVLFIAAACYGLIAEMIIFIDKINQWQVSTTVKYKRAEKLPFPAVTICSSNAANMNLDAVVVTVNAPTVTDCSTSASQQAPTGSGSSAGPPSGGSGGGSVSGSQQSQTMPNGGSSSSPPAGTQSTVKSSSGSQQSQTMNNGGSSPGPPPGRRRRAAGGALPSSTQAAMATSPTGLTTTTTTKETLSSVTQMYKIMEAVSKYPPQNLSAAGLQLCDLVLDCSYNAHSCNYGTDFKAWHWNWVYGNCWTFNSGFTRHESPSPQDASSWEYKQGLPYTTDGIRLATANGDTYGLRLILNTDQVHYSYMSNSSGWRIVIHNQTEMPFPENEGIFVMPGTSTRVGIELKTYEQLGTIDHGFYIAPYSDCLDASAMSLEEVSKMNAYTTVLDVGYSKRSCQKTCYQRNVMGICQCFDYYYPHVGKAFDANAIKLGPCYLTNDTAWGCKESVKELFINDHLQCTCPDTCTSYIYDLTVSSLRWPTADQKTLVTSCELLYNYMKDIATRTKNCTGLSLIADDYEKYCNSSDILNELKSCNDDGIDSDLNYIANYLVGGRFAEVVIYFKTFDHQAIEEGELWELADLIAYFGGIVGLFFGFTILTSAEYLILVFDLLAIGVAQLSMRFWESKNRISVSNSKITTNMPKACVGHKSPGFDGKFGAATRVQITSMYRQRYDSRRASPHLAVDRRFT